MTGTATVNVTFVRRASSSLTSGKVFAKWTALAGLIGTGALLFFTISATFIPSIYAGVMLFAITGGLLMVGWNIAMAVKMFRLARGASRREAGGKNRAAPRKCSALSVFPGSIRFRRIEPCVFWRSGSGRAALQFPQKHMGNE